MKITIEFDNGEKRVLRSATADLKTSGQRHVLEFMNPETGNEIFHLRHAELNNTGDSILEKAE